MLEFKHRHRKVEVKDATYMSIGLIDYYTREFDAKLEKLGWKQWIIIIPMD